MNLEKHIQDITSIQDYIMKKINAISYEYTTLSDEDKKHILLELKSNWIDHQLEKEKLIKSKEEFKMKKQYAYLDKYGIMHVADLATAQKYSKDGKVIEFNGATHHGYPAITQPITVKNDKATVYYDMLDKETSISMSHSKMDKIKKIYDKLK